MDLAVGGENGGRGAAGGFAFSLEVLFVLDRKSVV